MNKLNYNIRVKGYKMIGYLWYLISPILIIMTWLKDETPTLQFGDKIGMTVVIPLIFCLVTLLLSVAAEIRIFLPQILFQNPKLIYHENLGYFSGYTFKDNESAYIAIYKQNILTLNHIGDININSVSQIQTDIKKLLDKKYQKQLSDIKKNKEIEDTKKIVKTWDGYLSIRDRRDGKLEKLLKK